MGVMDVIAGQNLSQGNVDTVMKLLEMQSRNQQAALNASVQTRGQDVAAMSAAGEQATQARDTDVQAQTSIANNTATNATTMRGQDQQYQLGQDRNAMDSAFHQGTLDNQKKGLEIQEGDLKLKQADALLKQQQRDVISQSYQTGGFEGMKSALASLGEFKGALDIQDAQRKEAEFQHAVSRDQVDTDAKQLKMDRYLRGESISNAMTAINAEQDPAKQEQMGQEMAQKYGLDPKNWKMQAYVAAAAFQKEVGIDMKDNPEQIAAFYSKDSEAYKKAVERQQGLQVSTDAQGNTTVTMGGSGGKGGQQPMNAAIKANNDLQEAGDSLKLVENNYNADYLGYPARVKFTALQQLDRSKLAALDPETKKWYQGYVQFDKALMQTLNSYRRVVTGQAAALQEIDRIQDSYIHGKMGPEEFLGSMKFFRQQYDINNERVQSGLKNGGLERQSEFGSNSQQPQQQASNTDYASLGEKAMSAKNYDDAAQLFEHQASLESDQDKKEMLLLKAQQANRAAKNG